MVARLGLMMVTGVLVSACGLILGVESLSVQDETAAAFDASSEDGPSNGPIDSGSTEPFDAGVDDPIQERPPEGTYTYTVSGNDKVTGIVPLSTSTYGPTATVKVTYPGAGCFQLLIHLRNNYDERMDFCLRPDGDLPRESFTHQGGQRTQKFSVGSAATIQTCAPGDVYFNGAPPRDHVWRHECVGSNTDDQSGSDSSFTTAGDYRFVGTETISVAGMDIPVLHFRDERTVTGSQTGTNDADWYFAANDGVLVKLTRTINIKYAGFATYTESLIMVLSGLPDAGAR